MDRGQVQQQMQSLALVKCSSKWYPLASAAMQWNSRCVGCKNGQLGRQNYGRHGQHEGINANGKLEVQSSNMQRKFLVVSSSSAMESRESLDVQWGEKLGAAMQGIGNMCVAANAMGILEVQQHSNAKRVSFLLSNFWMFKWQEKWAAMQNFWAATLIEFWMSNAMETCSLQMKFLYVIQQLHLAIFGRETACKFRNFQDVRKLQFGILIAGC